MKQGPRVVKPRLGNEGSDRRRGDGVAVQAQMLYGVHVFARAKVIPDLAVSRGDEAYPNASEIGDPTLSAGGTAMAHLDLGDVDAAGTWLDRAAKITAGDANLLEQFAVPQVNEDYQATPLVITEGSSADKMDSIRRSDYLRANVKLSGLRRARGMSVFEIAEGIKKSDMPNMYSTLESLERRGVLERVPESTPRRYRLTEGYRP
jgi:hypothetical protein